MAEAAAPNQQRPPAGSASFYEQHATGLRKRCLQLAGDPVRADDLMQEVFARFLAKFPQPPSDMNVHGYLMATARNTWINQVRSERAVAIDQIDEARTHDDRVENDPVRSILLAEQRTHVRRSAEALTERQRRALTLRELDGRSYSEIGADLGLGSNAVAQIVWRARGQLRRSIRRSQIDVDRIPHGCRAMLDDMSDLVDKTSADGASELEAHITDCPTCRTTLATYQEAGSSFRGALPFVPVLALVTRLGGIVRAGMEATSGIGTAAAITAAAVATAGGAGAIVAHDAASPSGPATRSARARSHVFHPPSAAVTPRFALSPPGRAAASRAPQSARPLVVGRPRTSTRDTRRPVRAIGAPAPAPVRETTATPGSHAPAPTAPGNPPSVASPPSSPPSEPATSSTSSAPKVESHGAAVSARSEAPGRSKRSAVLPPKSPPGQVKTHATAHATDASESTAPSVKAAPGHATREAAPSSVPAVPLPPGSAPVAAKRKHDRAAGTHGSSSRDATAAPVVASVAAEGPVDAPAVETTASPPASSAPPSAPTTTSDGEPASVSAPAAADPPATGPPAPGRSDHGHSHEQS